MSQHLAERWDGLRLRRSLADAAVWLEGRAAEINALNVFPVPDGDTGTNMSLTLKAAVREAEAVPESSVAAVARAAAHGALLGARGNSGVILSQFLRGIARSLEKHTDCDGAEFAKALVLGSATAYKAVIRPVEGTMLTVGRDASQAALAAVEAGGDLPVVLEAAVVAARSSVARTPSLLPVLRQAGVVDAGGEGLLCLLEGLLRSFRGEPVAQRLPQDQVAVTRPAASVEYGYCTEFLIRGEGLDLESIRSRVVSLGDSALVVSDGNVARVHVHTFHPGRVLEYGASLGTLHQIKIDNMQDQHEHVLLAQSQLGQSASNQLSDQPAPGLLPPTGERGDPLDPGQPAMIAVAPGAGFADIFRSLGVSAVVPGGQTMNPSIEEILRAVEEVPARQVLLLPNNGNILLAAKQVHLLTDRELVVVPTRDVAQGVAAALAYQPDADLTANARAMERAFRSIRTGEVTTAVRAARVDGFEVRPGQVVGLVGGQLVAVGADPADIIQRALEKMEAERAQVLTLYHGAEVEACQAQAMAALLRTRYPNLDVEVMSGGQPLYQYVMSVE